MYYVIDGLFLVWLGLALRAVLYGDRKVGQEDCWYNKLIAISLVGTLLAGCGFAQLARSPAEAGEFGALLTVLGTLAAGAIVAAFAFKYPRVAAAGRALPMLAAGGLAAALYMVLGAIAYFLGASGIGHHPGAASAASVAMLALIVAQVLYDNMTYRDAE